MVQYCEIAASKFNNIILILCSNLLGYKFTLQASNSVTLTNKTCQILSTYAYSYLHLYQPWTYITHSTKNTCSSYCRIIMLSFLTYRSELTLTVLTTNPEPIMTNPMALSYHFITEPCQFLLLILSPATYSLTTHQVIIVTTKKKVWGASTIPINSLDLFVKQ